MKRCIVLAVLVSVIPVGAVAAPGGQAAEVKEAASSGTYEARCVVKISWEPELVPLSAEVVEAIVSSSNISRRAAREVLGPAADAKGVSIIVGLNPLMDEPGKLVGWLEVALDDDREGPKIKPAAEEVMHMICDRLREALVDFGKSDTQAVREEHEAAERELDEVRERLNQLRERRRGLLNDAGQSDLSRDRIVDKIQSLEAQKEDLGLDLAGQRARQEALEQRVAQIGEKAEARRSSGDAVAAELQKVVEIREMELSNAESLYRVRNEETAEAFKAIGRSGVPGPGLPGPGEQVTVDLQAQVLERREALAMARAELARHRQEVAREADEQLVELNRHLAELAVENAEADARLRYVESRLAEIAEKGLLSLADEYESLEMELDMAAGQVAEATGHRHELARSSRSIRPPTVTVVGGN